MSRFQKEELVLAKVGTDTIPLLVVKIVDFFPNGISVTWETNKEAVISADLLLKCRYLLPTERMQRGDYVFISDHWEEVFAWMGNTVGKEKVLHPVGR